LNKRERVRGNQSRRAFDYEKKKCCESVNEPRTKTTLSKSQGKKLNFSGGRGRGRKCDIVCSEIAQIFKEKETKKAFREEKEKFKARTNKSFP